jgi:hypothetical protein
MLHCLVSERWRAYPSSQLLQHFVIRMMVEWGVHCVTFRQKNPGHAGFWQNNESVPLPWFPDFVSVQLISSYCLFKPKDVKPRAKPFLPLTRSK